MSLSKKYLTVLTLIAGLILLVQCYKSQPGKNSIALVGEREIDWKMIWRSFNLDARWHRGETKWEAYNNQLKLLIDEKLFAQEALAHSMDTIPKIAAYIKAIKEKEMIKELYRRDVMSEIEISEDEYKDGYVKLKKKLKFEYIYAANLQQAEIYKQRLQNTLLENIQLIFPAIEEKGVSPMLTYGEMTEEFENVAYAMQLGETGGPFVIDGRYMVVKLIDGSINRFASKMDYSEKKHKIKQVITDRRAVVISDNYIYELLKDENVKIHKPAFSKLANLLKKTIKNKTSTTPLQVKVTDTEINLTLNRLEDIVNMTLVSFKQGSFTIEQFLKRFLTVPLHSRLQLNHKSGLRKAIAVSVRDFYLAQQAYQINLDKEPVVQYEMQIQTDKILAAFWLKKIREQLTVSGQEIEALKQKENYNTLNNNLGNRQENAALKMIILDYKFAKLQNQLADSLNKVYSVKIDTTKLIGQIDNPDEILNYNPNAFMYVEKYYSDLFDQTLLR